MNRKALKLVTNRRGGEPINSELRTVQILINGSAAFEGEWTEERLLETGERIWNLERQFNLAAGISYRDDTLPRRLLDEPCPSGIAKGKVAELGAMLPEYYALRGWSTDGVPTAETLARLGLSTAADPIS